MSKETAPELSASEEKARPASLTAVAAFAASGDEPDVPFRAAALLSLLAKGFDAAAAAALFEGGINQELDASYGKDPPPGASAAAAEAASSRGRGALIPRSPSPSACSRSAVLPAYGRRARRQNKKQHFGNSLTGRFQMPVSLTMSPTGFSQEHLIVMHARPSGPGDTRASASHAHVLRHSLAGCRVPL